MSQHAESGTLATAPQLITYADRLGGTIAGLHDLLSGPLEGAFGGVHLLPFYRTFDGADAGFDPEDHTCVDARLGTWDDVRALSRDRVVMADVIVNHMSSASAQFQDVLARGDASPYAGMFLTMSTVFPDGATEEDLLGIYRPRPGLPFTALRLGDQRRLVWTTFTEQQIDLDIHHPATWTYLSTVVDRLTGAGVRLLRLDAVGYAGKRAGTDCFLTEDCMRFIRRIRDHARARGAEVLVEVHGHYRQQLEIARSVDHVYDFALPPLVLHALHAGDPVPLHNWLAVRPGNSFTVLDTHDGIGIVDVGPSVLRPGEEGLLTEDQIDKLVEAIHTASGGGSRAATGAAASNLDLYQVNCTFYDALGADDDRYLLARMIQLFVPGTPQIYYVGLLAGRNDLDLLARTGVGRDVNRHRFTAGEITSALRRPLVKSLLAALRFRAAHPAFGGAFTHRTEGTTIELRWQLGEHEAVLSADVATSAFTVEASGPDRLALRSGSAA
ncbi:sucrose phosphorylase [Actinacidiphila guanduensis]|uniref:Sucrose phosphorylase n=1 Tax=Actinacidiphila guanduensis TaxID=310781 RepID=A0A1G9WC94_9ACTN|nr:sucrose phosphorylase [Actinacidiphila guanduensis]SDM81893.1 sucrose phosphorylase [Actinacidiphila guanduensis]